MPTQMTQSILVPPTRMDPKNPLSVVAEELKPLPLPKNARHSNSSPEVRPVEYHDPILEEDEDTASEVVEPVTPTSDSTPQGFPSRQQENDPNQTPVPTPINNTLATNAPPIPPTALSTVLPTSRPTSKQSQAPSVASSQTVRPPVKRTPSKLRSLFRRSNSQVAEDQSATQYPPTFDNNSTINAPAHDPTPRRWSMSRSAHSSYRSSTSNTPPSPGSPTSTVHIANDSAPKTPQADSLPKKPYRSSTGLSLKSKVAFGTTPKPQRMSQKKRSNSVTDLNKERKEAPDISIPAQAGSGLKARRLSTSLPDDFFVDTCALNEEYTSASKLPGRKKQIGTGATATVKIMARKGDSGGAQYAVKEFRKRSQKEDEHEYEQKVMSEFSIASSLHHQNIVESVRLCTHSGRWNHVMEYCQHGDIFALMEQKYLKREDYLCFFKQLLQGVAYLHERGIAHRDIKLENLLMNNLGHLKITDFGVSEVFSGRHPGLRARGPESEEDMKECRRCAPGICGSLPYIAPEVLAKNGDYDPRPLDVWSCAIVFLTMWHGGTPWQCAERKYPYYEKFASGWDKFFESHPDGIITDDALPKVGPVISTLPSPGMKRLILQMLHPDPEKRVSIHQAAKDRWVKSIDCCCVNEQQSKETIKLDAAGKKGCQVASKMTVRKCHNHLPPEKRRIPQHRFDMGNGWSRYD